MSLAIKPGYVNPLTMMRKKENAQAAASPITQQKSEKKDDVKNLETRQQALQNSMLLLKSTSDGASGSAQTQEVLQEELEQIASELKTARSQVSQAAVPQPVIENFDRYIKGPEQTDSPGLYQIQKGEETNYKISFAPYAEEQ